MIVTDNGRYLLNDFVSGDASNKMILYISGVDDGCTMMLQFMDERGNYVDLQSGAMVNATQNIIYTGANIKIFMLISARANSVAMSLSLMARSMS